MYVDSKTGKVQEIYNHMSSHLMFSGRVLHEFYSTEEKVSELFALGDVYCLGYSVETVPEDKQNDEVYRNGSNHCVFYKRDLNDPKRKTESRSFNNLNEAISALDKNPQQFTYIFRDGKWYYRFWKHRVEEMIPVRIFHDDEEDG